MSEFYLDAKGMKCPMPIVAIAKKIKEMSAGQTLTVEADDPVFRPDLEAWSRKTGHEIESIEQFNDFTKAIIKK